MKIKPIQELYLARVPEVLANIRIVYMTIGKEACHILYSVDERCKLIMEKMDSIRVAWDLAMNVVMSPLNYIYEDS